MSQEYLIDFLQRGQWLEILNGQFFLREKEGIGRNKSMRNRDEEWKDSVSKSRSDPAPDLFLPHRHSRVQKAITTNGPRRFLVYEHIAMSRPCAQRHPLPLRCIRPA